jgi:mannose-6-phosphate isomerase-like protein (cupin superfamily)
MKRVVTGVNEHGRSYIVSAEELDTAQPHNVWDFEPDQVMKTIGQIDPSVTADWIGPTVGGGARWIYAPMKPDSEGTHVSMDGIDEDGFHTTRTVDFDFIADGELTMVLDEDRITLHAGDFVIQQATRHAWKNESDKVAVLIALIHRPDGVK